MRGKKSYPYPSYKNPIRLSPLAQEAQEQLRELAGRIIANEKIFQRKRDKIPALWFLLPTAYFPNLLFPPDALGASCL